MAKRRLSAGFLRHSVTIQSRTDVSDGRGGSAPTWGTHVAVWANVSPVSSGEAFSAGQLQGSITHRVTLRYQSGITTGMRVLWGSRVLLIEGVRNLDEERRVVVLDCREERV